MLLLFKKNLANMVTGLGIVSGIIACTLAVQNPSWQVATGLLIFSLVTDGLDGKIARKFWSTQAGAYLDDIADLINFGIHPAIWIWFTVHYTPLAALYVISIIYRLVRFTIKKQHTSSLFSGLPSPAWAIGVFGIIFSPLDINSMMIGVLFIICLSVSSLPCLHVVKTKKIQRLIPIIAIFAIILPFLFWGGQYGFAITELVLIGTYILFSLISMIPHYVTR